MTETIIITLAFEEDGDDAWDRGDALDIMHAVLARTVLLMQEYDEAPGLGWRVRHKKDENLETP